MQQQQQQQQQQPLEGQPKQQRKKQQPPLINGILSVRGGVLKKQQNSKQHRTKPKGHESARIRWPQSIHEPPNRYYRGMTHPGTASGTATAWPPPRKKGDPPGGGVTSGTDGVSAGDDEGEPEDAVAAYFRSNPDAMRALMAQLMQAQGGGGRGGGRGGIGQQQAGAGRRRVSPLAVGRRHHVAVAYMVCKRIPKRENPMQ